MEEPYQNIQFYKIYFIINREKLIPNVSEQFTLIKEINNNKKCPCQRHGPKLLYDQMGLIFNSFQFVFSYYSLLFTEFKFPLRSQFDLGQQCLRQRKRPQTMVMVKFIRR